MKTYSSMHQDLSFEPELLPPMPLAEAVPERKAVSAAACGAVFLALASAWGFSVSAPDRAHAAPIAAPQSIAPAAPVRIALPVELNNVAAGQPSVLSAPAGAGETDGAVIGLAASGVDR
jgi:hypothetical protein